MTADVHGLHRDPASPHAPKIIEPEKGHDMPRSHATTDLRPNRTDRATSLRAPEREDISFLSGGERCDGWLYRLAVQALIPAS